MRALVFLCALAYLEWHLRYAWRKGSIMAVQASMQRRTCPDAVLEPAGDRRTAACRRPRDGLVGRRRSTLAGQHVGSSKAASSAIAAPFLRGLV
jgi:hypothetical protein